MGTAGVPSPVRRLTMMAAHNFLSRLLSMMKAVLDKVDAHYAGGIGKADKTATARRKSGGHRTDPDTYPHGPKEK
jgi:hypothetical protein